MLDVLIVGAGIGGLTAARAVAQAGLSARVIERAPRPSPAGAGIMLAGNALACLEGLGRRDAVVSRGRWLPSMQIRDRAGAVLGGMLPQPPGSPTALLALHRGALHEALLEDLDVPIEGGTSVAEVEAGPEAVTATLSTGEAVKARLLIGADGIGSQVRNLTFGDAAERRYAGYTCWRVVVPDPGVEAGGEMWGAGQRVGIIPLADGMLYSFLVQDAPFGTPGAGPTSADDLKRRFAGFSGDAPALLAGIDDTTDILHHDLEYLCTHHFAAGRVGLLGDAAHALTPNMGQGAAMAIEDSFVLGEALAAHGPSAVALEAYASRRRPRVREIAQRSLRIGQMGQWSNPVACAVRDFILRMTPASVGSGQVRKLVDGGPAACSGAPKAGRS